MQRIIREEFARHALIAIAYRLSTILDFGLTVVLHSRKLKECDSPTNLLNTNSSLRYFMGCTRWEWKSSDYMMGLLYHRRAENIPSVGIISVLYNWDQMRKNNIEEELTSTAKHISNNAMLDRARNGRPGSTYNRLDTPLGPHLGAQMDGVG